MTLYHSAKGSVNYTIVGNPTIVDGVMTYSNVSNYVRTRQNFLSSYNDYEIVCKCAKRLSTEEIVYCMSTGNNGNLQARLLSNAFRFIPHTFSNYIEIRGTFATDVWYWFKVRRTGNTIYASYSTDGVSWSNEVSKTFTQLTTSSNWIAFGTRVVSDSSWNGTSIDLNHTYIKVNGQPWFGVCPVEVQKHQLKGPVGYEVVGSPTIVDGVVSGFSSSNYLRLNGVIDFTQSFELFTELIIDEPKAGWYPVIRFKNFYTITATNNRLSFITNNYAPAMVTGFELNRYYCKFSWNVDTSTVTLAVSPDKITWYENSGTFTPGSGYSNLIIGTNIYEGSFNGSIDLNNTYIKVNGKLWFYQPADTKYIVKDGKLVWADPRIYIYDNGTITYATQNIAPVPAGLTFGTTTTPSIGYVDMRTQEFTSAPQGATIGRGEPPQPVNNSYTVQGNPTISGDIISGFSANDYLKANFSSSTPERGQIQSFEMVLDFTTGDTISASNERIVGLSASTSYFPTVHFKDDSAPHLVCTIFGTSGYNYEWKGGNNMSTYGSPLVPNTHYTARVWWSKYNPDWSTNANITNFCLTQIKNPTTGEWENSGSLSGIYNIDITDTTFLIGSSYNGAKVFNGSIDISKCYVKIDGEMWWDGSGGR